MEEKNKKEKKQAKSEQDPDSFVGKDEGLKIDISQDSGEEKELVISKNNIQDEIELRKKKAKLFLMINLIIFVVALIFLVAIFFFISHNKAQDIKLVESVTSVENLEDAQVGNLLERKIDGVMVSESEANAYLVATMIDNHKDARPPSGLDKAHLVFEAEVEGGLTRFMAVFSTGQDIEEIGPIRSARPYFVDWSRELNALYAHVGGSPDALVKIQQDKILDINEFYNGQYYWRADDRPMPHNVYTSIDKLEEFLSKKNADRNKFMPWNFKEDKKKEDLPDRSIIKIDYKIKDNKVEWKYSSDDNAYIRYEGSEPHRTKAGNLIIAKNVLVQVADAVELDDKLRLEMKNIGSGEALICMDGNCSRGTWQKKHPSDRTRFYLEDSKEASFNRGMTWVQVVRPEIEYTFE